MTTEEISSLGPTEIPATQGASSDNDVARIQQRISDLIAEKFKESEVYYLSQLGAQLGADRKYLEKLTEKKFAMFLRETFPFEIGKTGEHQNVLFLKNPNPVTRSPTVAASNATGKAAPRFIPRFWAAFAIPLRADEDRHIDLDTCDFGSKETMFAHGKDIRRIDPSFIAPQEASGSATETVERIYRWLETEGLDAKRFELQPRRTRNGADSLLQHLLSALDRDQLKRVNLPLDVVKSLSDRRI